MTLSCSDLSFRLIIDYMYELVYCSSAKQNLGSEDIPAILKTARDFNSKNNITGCLLYYKHEFIQILEGDQGIIKDLFSRIDMDERHKDITVLAEAVKKKEYLMTGVWLSTRPARKM